MELPLNCKVEYLTSFLTTGEAETLYSVLIKEYELDKARIIKEAGGRIITTDTFKILFSTESLIKQNSHPEEIHGKVYPWKGVMAQLREKVEKLLNKEFEIAMCLYYPDGNYFAPYHSDQETSGFDTTLPSISLGEVREFSFKNIENEDVYNLDLASGSLLVMSDYCQSRYMHSLLKNTKYKNGRINITFREPDFK